MKINIQIERLILDGIQVAPHEHPMLQAAIEGELARLMTTGGLSSELAAGVAVPAVNGAALQLSNDAGSMRLGEQIAQAAYGGIRK